MQATQTRMYHVKNGDTMQHLAFDSAKRAHTSFKAEIRLEDGNKRYFHATSKRKKAAIKEITQFVEALENATHQRVLWRLKSESTYHFGSDLTHESFSNKVAKVFNYFFDLED